MPFKNITESNSPYRHLEKMGLHDLLVNINAEDKIVAETISNSIPQIELMVQAIIEKMKAGGRLFYIGAGTSGRLGILDAAECPPTFGVSKDLIIGIIAGGKKAIKNAVEFIEDDTKEGWKDLKIHKISTADFVIGISASGYTPYTMGALEKCKKKNILTGAICSNPSSPINKIVDFPVEVVTGSEFLTGSTRMKAGTAQKLILNMISTSVMIQLGKVADNKMINMQLNNTKLVERGTKMLMENLKLDHEQAKRILVKYGSVKKGMKSVIKE